ncbi:hypothetical protein [Stutzerimonas stutzeri]|jgi:hypothetical protein|uniref:Uncharacterized protein n=1 Tax=Stutzerimonas stutzeri TaxID=316 RepID=A0A5S5B5K0_STUST|nr:hypothetical protein [Stutzerimonas stutzeri]TYP62224.1 hypothetical protein A9A72_124977 [Stutzerimonas stutzeri]
MSDPLDKAGAKAPPIIGSGCTQRYDLDRLGPDLGTDFPGAETLWERHVATLDASVGDGESDVVVGAEASGSKAG